MGPETEHQRATQRAKGPGKGTGAPDAQVDDGLAAALQSKEVLHAIAARGVDGAGDKLPHLDRIQAAFGDHDVGGVKARVGGPAAAASEELGAKAYATGDSVAFKEEPDLHTAAHEATHILQQRQGVALKGGLGRSGDAYERHADAVADRVVAGGSAVGLLDGMAGGGGGAGVQRKAERAVQPGVLGDMWDAAVDAVESVIEWIDLLGPKQDVRDKLADTCWIDEARDGLEYEAHPDHAILLDLDLWLTVVGAHAETQALAGRVADCDDKESVDALDAEVDQFVEGRVESLTGQLEEVIERYREIERSWVSAYATGADVVKDPINPNQSDQKAKLTLKPGLFSQVIVETTASWTFGHTADAKKAKVKAWTGAEKAAYKSKFQKQLDDVWGPSAQSYDPFRVSAPPDYLLTDDPDAWSTITADFTARISDAASNAHFAITVEKEGPKEENRASVGTGSASLYFADQNAGYDAKGRRTGGQHTLAHEWMHMVGNADEYAETSKDDTDDAKAGEKMGGFEEQYKKRYGDCLAHFDKVIENKDKKFTAEQIAQAKEDKDSIVDPYGAGPDGSKINRLATPNASRVGTAPDTCFATRNVYDPDEAQLLRPGARSERGGTNITMSARDEQRLSDSGNQVRPYIREGLLGELNAMLSGVFTPNVQFDHNFEEMPAQDEADVWTGRLNTLFTDIEGIALGVTQAATGSAKPDTHSHHGH